MPNQSKGIAKLAVMYMDTSLYPFSLCLFFISYITYIFIHYFSLLELLMNMEGQSSIMHALNSLMLILLWFNEVAIIGF